MEQFVVMTAQWSVYYALLGVVGGLCAMKNRIEFVLINQR